MKRLKITMFMLAVSGLGRVAPTFAQHGRDEHHQQQRQQGPQGPPRQQRPEPPRQQGPQGGAWRGQPPPQQPQQRPEPPRQQGPQGGAWRGQPPPQQPQQRHVGGPPGGGNDRRYPQQQAAPRQAREWQRQAGWRRQGGWQEHHSWQEHRAQHWDRDHRTWGQRGGYGGRYIPQDRFYRTFGDQNVFRIRSRPTIYMGYPRFQYGGYGFIFVDPWPEYWSENWYESDEVYVDYDDGYYLHNRRYPDVAIAITVVP